MGRRRNIILSILFVAFVLLAVPGCIFGIESGSHKGTAQGIEGIIGHVLGRTYYHLQDGYTCQSDDGGKPIDSHHGAIEFRSYEEILFYEDSCDPHPQQLTLADVEKMELTNDEHELTYLNERYQWIEPFQFVSSGFFSVADSSSPRVKLLAPEDPRGVQYLFDVRSEKVVVYEKYSFLTELLFKSATNTYVSDALAGDINGDGTPDLAAFASNGSLYAVVSQGSSWSSPVFIAQESWLSAALAIGDINNDGNADLVVGGSQDLTSRIVWYPGKGDGTFQPGQVVSENSNPIATIGLADLTGDKSLDIVADIRELEAGKYEKRIYVNNGNGAFFKPSTVLSNATLGIQLGDFNGDGIVDAIFGGYDPAEYYSETALYLGDGQGSFLLKRTFGIRHHPILADFNGDNILDILACPSIYFGNGQGLFLEEFQSELCLDKTTGSDPTVVKDANIPHIIVEDRFFSGRSVLGPVSFEGRWEPLPSLGGLPDPYRTVAAWAGSALITWSAPASSGPSPAAIYRAESKSWSLSSPPNDITLFHYTPVTAIWTGREVIFVLRRAHWGSWQQLTYPPMKLMMYDPSTDSWRFPNMENAPAPWRYFSVVWTGNKLVIWGGLRLDGRFVQSDQGGIYDPASDSWTETSRQDAPQPMSAHSAVWTGSKMIVWGSTGGGVFDPETNAWSSISRLGAPLGREGHTAVWTGSKMIVWGGQASRCIGILSKDGRTRARCRVFDNGGIYDLSTDQWARLDPGENSPSRRTEHRAVWTGNKMIVWGGYYAGTALVQHMYPNVILSARRYLPTGGSYDPETNTWQPTTIVLAPRAPQQLGFQRSMPINQTDGFSMLWTGKDIYVWGFAYNPSGAILPLPHVSGRP